jgi:hypothetical protein
LVIKFLAEVQIHFARRRCFGNDEVIKIGAESDKMELAGAVNALRLSACGG